MCRLAAYLGPSLPLNQFLLDPPHSLVHQSWSPREMYYAKMNADGYGFGWYLYGDNPTYGPIFGHNGAQIGCTSFLMILPEQNTVVAVASNTSGAMGRVFEITINLFKQAAAAE